jgi:inositol transport system substrate-binding protein
MTKKKVASTITAFTLAAGLLAGCGSGTTDTSTSSSSSTAAAAAAESDEIVIGVTLQNLSEEFMIELQTAMETEVATYDNVKLIINDAESETDKQASQLDSFVSQQVDAVIISPVDADALASSVKSVVDAGIPVITCSADVSGDQGQVWVGSANENGGELEMRYVAEQLGGEGNIAVLRGPLGAFAEEGRFTGYETVLAEYPDIQIVFDQTANWQRDEAMSLIENLLTTGTEIDAIVCQNDAMALGALEACKAAGQDDIIITGIDAIKDALDAIAAGEMDATCFQDAKAQGSTAVDMAVKAANGEAIEETDIPFELVTADNVEEYYDRI